MRELREIGYPTLQSWVNTALGDATQYGGVVAYSGQSVWKPGRYIIMGFNPAADGTNENLGAIVERPYAWSLYSDKCWKCGETMEENHRHSLTRHQKTVHHLCKLLGVASPRDVFATNAIFVESKDVAGLLNWPELFAKCWAVHLQFLELVKPEWIICLGNSDGASSFSLIRRKMQSVTPIKECGAGFRDGKWFEGQIGAGAWTGAVKVLGLPHPSRFGLTLALESFLTNHVART